MKKAPAGKGENFQNINMYFRLFPFVAWKSFRFTIWTLKTKEKLTQNQPGQVKGKEGGGGGDEDGGQVELLLSHLKQVTWRCKMVVRFNSFLTF